MSCDPIEQAFQLRDYQQDTLSELMAPPEGVWRDLAVLATSAGKTIIFAAYLDAILEPGERGLVLAHRTELLTQARDKIAMVAPSLDVEIEQADSRATRERDMFTSSKREVVVGSVQSMRGNRLKQFAPDAFKAIIVDECFPAGTLVDGRPIEMYQVGDELAAFDESMRSIVTSRVTRLFKKPVTNLVRVHAGSESIVCTPNHPFFTAAGWKNAEVLCPGRDYVYRVRRSRGDDTRAEHIPLGYFQEDRPRVLFNELRQRVLPPTEFVQGIGYEQPISVCSDDCQKSNAPARDPRQSVSNTEVYRSRSENSRRKRTWTYATGEIVSVSPWMADIGSRDYQPSSAEGNPVQLQSGCGEQAVHDRNRDRRQLTPRAQSTRTRPEENSDITGARVDRIEILEPGSDGTFGCVCPDGFVYNLEVERHHTYIANGFVVHNCHHNTSASYRAIIEHFGCMDPERRTRLVGVTATPNRTDGEGLGSIFQRIAVNHGIVDLSARGWLAPLHARCVSTDVDLTGIGKGADGDYKLKELSKAVDIDGRNRLILSSYLRYARDRKTIVFAASVEHAKTLANLFTQAGIPSEPVWGEMGSENRQATLARFDRGETIALMNMNVLTEGTDLPTVSCIILARPTQSSLLLTQMVGRGLRLSPGKENCMVIDVQDVTKGNSCVSVPSLIGLPRKFNADGKSVFAAKKQFDLLDPRLSGKALSPKAIEELLAKMAAGLNVVEVDLLAAIEVPKEITHGSSLAWFSPMPDTYMLRANKTATYRVSADTLSKWTVEMRPDDKAPWTVINAGLEQLNDAFMAGDQSVQQTFPESLILLDRTAKWRKDSPTEKQIEWLLKKRVFQSADEIPKTMTKGDATALLDAVFNKNRRM
jgi:ATP-dependent helicase IRC3